MVDLDLIGLRLAGDGLAIRGGVMNPVDAIFGDSGKPACHLLLIGHGGSVYWRYFQAWRSCQAAELANPLDSWTRSVVEPIAEAVGAKAFYPSDKPYMPFQRWAIEAEGLKPSPLGILMHPEYGLWHAYRAALLFDRLLDVPEPNASIHLCDGCAEKPCMKSCPVSAYSEAGFDYENCLRHVRGPSGKGCRKAGCFDRNACPYGTAYRYPAEVQAFHMSAFARAA